MKGLNQANESVRIYGNVGRWEERTEVDMLTYITQVGCGIYLYASSLAIITNVIMLSCFTEHVPTSDTPISNL